VDKAFPKSKVKAASRLDKNPAAHFFEESQDRSQNEEAENRFDRLSFLLSAFF
jgi:hypothetical protein